MGSRNVSLAQQRDLQHQVHSHSQNEVRQYEIAELWNSYLKQVLFKRILLRQEINMFQNFMATLATSNNQPNTRHNITESTVGTSSYNESSILAPLKSMRGENQLFLHIAAIVADVNLIIRRLINRILRQYTLLGPVSLIWRQKNTIMRTKNSTKGFE